MDGSSAGEVERRAAGLDEPRSARALLAVVSVVYVVLALWLTRSTTAFVDEVAVFVQDDGLRPSALLAPLNGHLALFQRLTYTLDWHLLGAEYVPLRLLEVGGVVVVAWELHVLLARRTGPALAACAACLLLLLGSAWELNYVVSGLGNVAALAFGLGALLALERGDRRGDVLAAIGLLLSIVSFSLALAVVAGVAVRLLLERGGLRRLWVVAPAVVVWLAWFAWVQLGFADRATQASSLSLKNIFLLPQAVAESAAATVGALTGTNYPLGSPELLFEFGTTSVLAAPLLVLGVAWALVRLRRRPWLVDPPLLGGVAMAVAFWAVLGLGYGSAGRSPSTVRYVYAGAVFLLLAVGWLSRGVRPGGGRIALAVVLVGLAAASNLVRLRDGMAIYRPASLALRATYAGVDVAGRAADPAVRVGEGPLAVLQQVEVGPYLLAAGRLGSPGWTQRELLGRPEAERAAADDANAKALGLALVPAAATTEGCRPVPAGGEVAVRPPGARIVAAGAGGTIGLRRFATTTLVGLGALAAGGQELRLPADGSRRPWVLRLDGAGGYVC